MEPWKPWDATEDEYADLLVIREPIPETLNGSIDQWLRGFFRSKSSYQVVDRTVINTIEAALRVTLDLPDHPDGDDVTEAIRAEGDRYTLQVIDFLIAQREPDQIYGTPPDDVAFLMSQMDLSSSGVRIVRDGRRYRIARRLAEGIEEAAQKAIYDANQTAGQHLAKAWREMQSMTPDASKVLREGIQAVEAAGGAVVIPRERKPQLSKIVQCLRAQKGWGLAFARRDDDQPDHLGILIGMLETLAFAEQHRHSGHGYSEVQAVGHVQLAATLVGWFSAGVVVRAE